MNRIVSKHLVTLFVLFTLIVAACAPAAAPSPAQQPAAPAQPKQPAPAQAPVPVVREEDRAKGAAPTPTPAAKGAKYGGTLVAPTDRQAPNLDTLGTQAAGQGYGVSPVYGKLVRVERGPGGFTDIVLVPDLAERWEVSPDGKQYTFFLKKGAKFQKIPPVNGREVTADDIKYTFERIQQDPASPFKAKYIVMQKIEVLEKYTVRFSLERPWALWLDTLAAEPAYVVAKEVEKMAGGFKGNAIGSGPMILVKHDESVGEFYRKNPDYHSAEHVYFDKFTYLFVPDPATRIAAFRAGELELIGGTLFNSNELEQVKRTNPDLLSDRQPAYGMSGMWLKFGNPTFKDLRVRQAISKAIDRDRIIQVMYKGDADYNGIVPPVFGKWGLSQEELRKHYALKFDLVEAKRLLAEAGYPNGVKFQMEIQSGGGGARALQFFETSKKDLESVGILVTLKPLEYGTWLGNCYGGLFAEAGSCGQYMFSVWDHIFGPYYTDAWRNGGNISLPELDKMLLDAIGVIDPEQRRQKAFEVQRYVLDKVLWKVNYPEGPNYWVWHPWVKNVRPVFRPYDQTMILIDVWIDK